MRVGARKRSRNSTIAGLIIGGAIVIGVIIFLVILNKNVNTVTQVQVSDNSFTTTGMYGATFLFSDISSVELKDTIPKILERTNGAAIGQVKKGDFKVEYLGKCRLYLQSDAGPYVLINVNDFFVIINYTDEAETKRVYEELAGKTGKSAK